MTKIRSNYEKNKKSGIEQGLWSAWDDPNIAPMCLKNVFGFNLIS